MVPSAYSRVKTSERCPLSSISVEPRKRPMPWSTWTTRSPASRSAACSTRPPRESAVVVVRRTDCLWTVYKSLCPTTTNPAIAKPPESAVFWTWIWVNGPSSRAKSSHVPAVSAHMMTLSPRTARVSRSSMSRLRAFASSSG